MPAKQAELAMDRSERTSGPPPFDDLPATVQAAFQNRTMLTAKELASLLEMDPDTLRKHIKNGDIKGRTKGTGRVRRMGFYNRRRGKLSSSPRPPRCGGIILFKGAIACTSPDWPPLLH